MLEKTKEFNEFFSETYVLFRRIAAYSTYLEKLDSNYVNIGVINELRGVLYHLYGYLDEKQAAPEFMAANYIEAKEHLIRGYFDLFSAICTVLSDRITNFGEVYSIEIISEIYPLYYTVITPKLYNLFEEVSHVRTTRKIEDSPFKIIEANHAIVIELKDWYTTLVSLTEAFEKRKKLLKAKSNKDLFWKICIPLVALLLGFFLNHYVGNNTASKNNDTSIREKHR